MTELMPGRVSTPKLPVSGERTLNSRSVLAALTLACNAPATGALDAPSNDNTNCSDANPDAGRGTATHGPKALRGHAIVDLSAGTGSISSAVAAAVAAGVPARRVASRSASNILISMVSNKMGASMAAESPWEERALTLADVLEDVIAFSPQPVELRWSEGERTRRAYPDIGVVLLDGTAELWECKSSDTDHLLAAKLKPLAVSLTRRGVRYRARTPRWLAAQPRLSNAQRLAVHGTQSPDLAVCEAIARALPLVRTPVLGALRETTGAGAAQLLCAAAHGVFAVCIDGVRLGDASPIRASKPGARSGAYLFEVS